jgi:ribosomal protein S18 acetylase RimI-like enzyme
MVDPCRHEHPVIEYRRFKNADPPGLVEVWNDALTGRGAARLRTSSPLESCTLSKLFFDPEGLIVAHDGDQIVGFVHAGFGANVQGSGLDYQSGVTCMLAVRSSYRGRGIGSELLKRSEDYLRSRGARQLFAGSMAPLNPFYLGLYGGSELPGFLATDLAAEPFFTRHGYQVCRTTRVLQRRLSVPVKVFDPRFVGYRQRFELCEDAASRLGTWWQYSLFNGAEPRVFSLLDRTDNQYAAQATVWEMEGFSYRWNLPAVGVADWFVRPDLQRQGVGKYLLTQVLRRTMEELLEVMELHIPSENLPAWKVCQALGFEQVDLGRMYQLQE